MKHKLEIRKTTVVSWIDVDQGFLTNTGVFGRPRPIYTATGRKESPWIWLVSISASTHDGKVGRLELRTRVPPYGFGGPTTNDFEVVTERLAALDHPDTRLGPMPTNSWGPFTFKVRVSKGKGFCEFVIKLVSEIARTLEVEEDDWFRSRLKIKQVTSVLVGYQWLEYGQYLVSKYPIRTKAS